MFEQGGGDAPAAFLRSIEEGKIILVEDEFHRSQQAFATDLVNMAMAADRLLQRGVEIGADIATGRRPA